MHEVQLHLVIMSMICPYVHAWHVHAQGQDVSYHMQLKMKSSDWFLSLRYDYLTKLQLFLLLFFFNVRKGQ